MSLLVLNNRLPHVAKALPKTVADYCAVICGAVLKEFATRAARDTGYMAESGYIVTAAGGSTYGNVGDGPKLPEVKRPEGAVKAIAAIAANYTSFVEYGTKHMGAQPAFYPGVDAVRGKLSAILGDFEKQLAAESGARVL